MTLRTWKIELRADFDSDIKGGIMEKAVRRHAKELITEAQLLSDSRKPDIALETSDMFVGATEIMMFEDGELDGIS